jgi:hypothetical protein
MGDSGKVIRHSLFALLVSEGKRTLYIAIDITKIIIENDLNIYEPFWLSLLYISSNGL